MMEARAGLSNFRAKLLQNASTVADRLSAQPLYRAALAVILVVVMLLLVSVSPIKGHATRVLIAESESAEHAALKIHLAAVPDAVCP